MQKIKIYNTLTRKRDSFRPTKGKKINLFVCGPTVYEFSHIGHARTYVFFDCFVKYLKHLGFKVFYLQNITNIDDKIILRARERGVTAADLAAAFEKDYLKDMERLGIGSVNKYARATDYIKEIISQINRLVEKGYAYRLDDGIYFDIAKFKKYGKLSGRTALQAEDATSRIDYSKNKRNRGDFCLWKYEVQGEPSWNSPFGKGRPGWHIEDTAITEKFFGPQYDIHGGGIDLLFPHHEAEVAQMEALSGKRPLAQYWMHTGFLTIDGQKMAKSLNNFITIGHFLERYRPQHLRFFVAKNLWRSPVNYSDSAMIEIRSALERIEEFLRKISAKGRIRPMAKKLKNSPLQTKIYKKHIGEFWNALADDFNTPKAFAAVFDLIAKGHTAMNEGVMGKKEASELYKFFQALNKIFGIIDFERIKKENIPAQVLELAKTRQELRKSKEWHKADELRLEIETYGYTIEDTPSGPLLKKYEKEKAS